MYLGFYAQSRWAWFRWWGAMTPRAMVEAVVPLETAAWVAMVARVAMVSPQQ